MSNHIAGVFRRCGVIEFHVSFDEDGSLHGYTAEPEVGFFLVDIVGGEPCGRECYAESGGCFREEL
ncbi:MAG: hypothetical protein D6692_10830 [Planctomycetota bacterium]|nr:MAG: hypothetical protein D6692_10830 [Planctomycetota bacterium]